MLKRQERKGRANPNLSPNHTGDVSLRIDLTAVTGSKYYAKYLKFGIGSESESTNYMYLDIQVQVETSYIIILKEVSPQSIEMMI